MVSSYHYVVDFTKLQSFTNSYGPILVTGHSGFKGSWLGMILDYLQIEWRGYSLNENTNWIASHRTNNQRNNAHNFDILDKETLLEFMRQNRVSAVLHLAAKPLVLDSFADPTQFFQTNIIGTSTVIEASVEAVDCKMIGVVTTDKVYFNENKNEIFVETDQLWGNEPYSASKVGAELVTASWHKVANFRQTPKAIRVLRSGNVIGGGDFAKNRLVPDLVRAFMTGEECEIRNPLSTRPWLHVIDPLIGYLLALQDSIGKSDLEAFNFGPTGQGIPVSEFANIFNQVFDNQIKLIFNKSTDARESKFLNLNSFKSTESLGWSPKLNQADSIIWTATWWRKYFSGGITVENIMQQEIVKYFSL